MIDCVRSYVYSRRGAAPRHAACSAIGAVLALSAALWPATALAQSDADRAAARLLAREAEEALNKKEFAAAADKYGRADALVHAPTLLLGLARAQVGLGKLVAAQESLNRIIREGVAPGAPPVFAKAVDAAKKELEVVAPRVPVVIIEVAGPTAPQVTIDKEPVPAAVLGVRRPVDPGQHVVRASADGWEPAEATFSIKEGAAEKVTLKLKKSTTAAAAPPVVAPAPSVEAKPQPQPAADSSSTGSTQRTVGYVTMGLGVVGLGVGGVFGLVAMGEQADAETFCQENGCAEDTPERTAWEGTATLSTIGFIAGGALAVGGLVIVLTAPSAKPATGAWVAPTIGPGFIGARGAF